MESSRKSRRVDLASRVSQQLSAHVKLGSKLVAALSGGLDSVVLLDVLDSLKATLGFELSALHINHGLNPNANEWEQSCRELCGSRAIPFEAASIEVPCDGNQEAEARTLRYLVFGRQDADFVVLAQHLDDQAETFMLRLLRGAGASGLSAMRRNRESGIGNRESVSSPHSPLLTPRILRPLLDIRRSEILSYARERKLSWIEDESNRDTRFDRNFLRREILPAFETRFPAYRETIARAADNLADAAGLLDDLAHIDARSCISEGAIAVAELKRLTPARARNVLRHFLRGHGLLMPDRAWLEQALHQILYSRSDAKVCISIGEFELRRYRQKIYPAPSTPKREGDLNIAWRGENEIVIPELGGVLRFTEASGTGISRSRFWAVTIRTRRGGERLRPDCNRPRRSLKNLLQEHAVPPWLRGNLPLLFSEETLVWAPGIGVACEYRAREDEMGITPEWANSNVHRF